MDHNRAYMDILVRKIMRPDTYLAHHNSGHFRYHRRPWTTSRADPVDFLIIWVTAGNMDATVGGERVHAAAGDLLVLEPGVAHAYSLPQDSGWEWFWLHFDGTGARHLWSRLTGPAGPVRTLGLDPQVRARFVELVTAAATTMTLGPSIHVDTCASSLLGLMIDRLEAQRDSGPAIWHAEVSALATWILDHLDTPITLSGLVRESGWSAAQLTRIMRREFNLAPMQYVTRVRMRQAELLLQDTGLTVAQVAQLVGFSDPLHFSRRFRLVTGRPPSHVRRGTRADAPGAD